MYVAVEEAHCILDRGYEFFIRWQNRKASGTGLHKTLPCQSNSFHKSNVFLFPYSNKHCYQSLRVGQRTRVQLSDSAFHYHLFLKPRDIKIGKLTRLCIFSLLL